MGRLTIGIERAGRKSDCPTGPQNISDAARFSSQLGPSAWTASPGANPDSPRPGRVGASLDPPAPDFRRKLLFRSWPALPTLPVMDRPIRRILAPIEFSELSEPEVDYTIAVAKQLEAELLLFGVIDRATMLTLIGKHRGVKAKADAEVTDSVEAEVAVETSARGGGGRQHGFDEVLMGDAGDILQRIVDRAAAEGVDARGHLTQSEQVADEILREAERQEVDLILINTKPRSLVSRALFGNTVEDVLKTAPCPVLVSKA